MSIEKNRLLMEQQVKRLRGELNESPSGDVTYDTAEVVLLDVWWDVLEKAQNRAIKKMMPVLKKLIKGKRIEISYKGSLKYTSSPVKEIKRLSYKPADTDDEWIIVVYVELVDGSQEVVEYKIDGMFPT
jgi:hypothetical protein